MKSSHTVTSISNMNGEHLWTFQGAKEEAPKMFAAAQARQCGDYQAARAILRSTSIVRLY